MRPRERRESGEQDLFRSRLDQIIDMSHLGAACEGDQLAVPGGAVWRGLYRWRRPAAVADAIDGGACDPQAHVQPQRRGGVRAVD